MAGIGGIFGGAPVVAPGLVAAALLLATPGTQAQTIMPFGRDAAPLTPEQRELVRDALREVMERYEPGARREWQTADRAGVVELIGTYEQDGMRCGHIRHEFTKGPGRPYEVPLCQGEDGRWLLAF